MTITGLHHVLLAMPAGREVEAIEFYEGLLGIPKTAKPPNLGGRGGCWFESDAVFVHLGVEDGFIPARKAHPAFEVDDIAALRRRLDAAEIQTVDDAPLPGFERFYGYDPFGNRLEFLQPLR